MADSFHFAKPVQHLPAANIDMHTHPSRVEAGSVATMVQGLGFYLTLLLLLVSIYSVYRDYRAFIDLGPGGTPQSIQGYLRITFLRLFALRDPCDPEAIPKIWRPEPGFFTNNHIELPTRSGKRPRVTGIAPHRQTTQKGSLENYAALAKSIMGFAATHSDKLCPATSCFEKHATGLFALRPRNRTCDGEICHAHPSDGSLHMTLHPQDAAFVLEKGWGERHPLAKGGWLTRFVPSGFVMIYAPRNDEELKVTMSIIEAAIWYVGGHNLTPIVGGKTL